MMDTVWKKENWTDLTNLVLGAFLFLSPWIFEYGADPGASLNAWMSGFMIVAVAVMALAAFADWEEWVNLAVGLWVVVSPWLVGFAGNATPASLHVLVGLAVAVMAGLRLGASGSSPRATSQRHPWKAGREVRPSLVHRFLATSSS